MTDQERAWVVMASLAILVFVSVVVMNNTPRAQEQPVLSITRHGDAVTVYVPERRAIVPLDTFRQVLINEDIL